MERELDVGATFGKEKEKEERVREESAYNAVLGKLTKAGKETLSPGHQSEELKAPGTGQT